MKRSYVKKRIKKMKELADKEKDNDSKELLMIFHDVFKFLVEKIPLNETETNEMDF